MSYCNLIFLLVSQVYRIEQQMWRGRREEKQEIMDFTDFYMIINFLLNSHLVSLKIQWLNDIVEQFYMEEQTPLI